MKSKAPAIYIIGLLIFVFAAATFNYKRIFLFPKFESTIAAIYKDPDSVKFQKQLMPNLTTMCGEANAKNGYGSYSGYKRFIADDNGTVYLQGEGRVATGESEDSLIKTMENADIVIESYKLRTERLENINEAIRIGEKHRQTELSEADAIQLAQVNLFNKKWGELCDK